MGAGHLVEDGDPAEIGAPLEEETQRIGELLLRADRIAQRGPRPSLHRVHDERGPRVVEQQGLVLEKRQVRPRERLHGDGLLRILEVGRRREARVRRITDQARETGEREMPLRRRPTRGRNRDASACSSNCHRDRSNTRCRNANRPSQMEAPTAGPPRRPTRGKRDLDKRGAPVEGRPRPPEDREHDQQQRGLFVVEALSIDAVMPQTSSPT